MSRDVHSESGSQWLSDSPGRGVADSPSFLLNIQKPTLRLAKSRSRFSIMNISANSKPKAERLER
jgi:hypothetical protein